LYVLIVFVFINSTFIIIDIIMNIIIPASENNIFVVPEENAKDSHLNSSEFSPYEYLAFPV